MNTTKLLNSAWYIVCLVTALGAEIPGQVFGVLPPHWKHWVLTASICAAWIKAHRNLFINPDGTPAAVAYVEPGGAAK
jgi:hypothetical protein